MPKYAEHLLVRCNRCGLVFASRLPSATELSDYYAAYPQAGEISELTVRRFQEMLDRFERFRKTGRLLDVGCGDGHFLLAAKERGWSAYGSEYGEGPRRRARARGLDVRPAPFEPAADEVRSFDVVTGIEVIEHVADPRDEVVRMAALLRPGGCLYLTTPNFDSLSRRLTGPRWRAIEYPEHLSLFTSDTLNGLLVAEGLSRVDLRTTGISPSDIRAGLKPARPEAATNAGSAANSEVRSRVAGSRPLERIVDVVNAMLARLRLGDTIKALYQLK